MTVGDGLVGVPADNEVVDGNSFEPSGREVENSLAFGQDVHLVHVVLNKKEIKGNGLVLVIIPVEIDIGLDLAAVVRHAQ